jgi:hypothetical protein
MPGINKLNGMDDWKFAMKILLMHEKLWPYAIGAVAGADVDAEKGH